MFETIGRIRIEVVFDCILVLIFLLYQSNHVQKHFQILILEMNWKA